MSHDAEWSPTPHMSQNSSYTGMELTPHPRREFNTPCRKPNNKGAEKKKGVMDFLM